MTEEPSIRSPYPLAEHLLGVLPLALLVLSLFALVGGETAIAGYFHAVREELPGTAKAVAWLSDFGNIPFYAGYALILAHAVRTGRGDGFRFVLHYLTILVLLLLAADVMKIWIGRPRPYVGGDFVALSLKKSWHSFPSNHMTETVFTVLSLALYLKRLPITVAGAVWIAIMGFSRLYLGRHHPTDLLGSAAVASVAIYALVRLTAQCAACPFCALLNRRKTAEQPAQDCAVIS